MNTTAERRQTAGTTSIPTRAVIRENGNVAKILLADESKTQYEWNSRPGNMPIPLRCGYNVAMESLLSLMSQKVEDAVEYAASASIYCAKTTVDELTTAQTLVVSLFHGLLFGDISFCSAVLQLEVEQLKSSYLNVWLRDDFLFCGHDVQMVMAMLSFVVETSKLRIPEHVLWIFGSLVDKYGVADCCTENLLAAFGDQIASHTPAPKVEQSSFIRRLRSSLRRSSRRSPNVSKKKDEEFVIVNLEHVAETLKTPPSPQLENEHNSNELNIRQANKGNSIAKVVPTECKQGELETLCISEPVPQVLHDPGIVTDNRPHDKSPVREVKVVYKDMNTLLHRLSQIGRAAALRRLIEAGAQVDLRDSAGKTALHWAAQYNHVEVVRLLLQSGADYNAKSDEGRTPLSYAPFYKNGVSDTWMLISEAGGTV